MRKAYLIGNANYSNKYWKSLTNPINDIHMVKDALEQCEFTVELFEDATMYDLKLFSQLENSINKYDTILLYYSGHGFEEDGDAYLVPVDADENTDSCFKITDLLTFICNVKGVKCILILDCCRNIFSEPDKELKRDIQKIKTREGAYICYSTTLGKSALDNNGVFATAFSNVVLQDKLCIEKVFKKVRIEVIEKSKIIKSVYSPGEYQVSCDYSTLVDEFYFVNSDIIEKVNECAAKFNDDYTIANVKKQLKEYYLNDLLELGGSIDYKTFQEKVFKLLLQ